MVNLKGNPFFLSDEDIKWVESTLGSMSTKDKVGQLFFPVGMTDDRNILKQMIDGIKPSGIMYRPGPGATVQETHRYLQECSEIPLMIAANLESGGNGIASDGTSFGKQMQVAATDNEDMAYKLGLVAGKEGRTVGCNWAFAPVIDIDYNFRNPITNTRTYGSDPDRVLRMATSYMKGIQESGLAVSIKHFPGDGVDERDQHLATTHNTLSVEDWDSSYGKIYQSMIDDGARTVMIGHITQPAYSRKLRPEIKDEEIKPATLAPELLNGLLREQMGFNGLIVTDATVMVGFTIAGKREETVPASIAAGCDMFLFNKDLAEDFGYMMKGVENGIVTQDRLDEAVIRILATKASLKLHEQKENGTLVPAESELSTLQCDDHKTWAKECSDQAVTLVKDTQSLLPLSVEKHKRVLVIVLGDKESHAGECGKYGVFIDKLEKEGFEVTKFEQEKFDMRDLIQPIDAFTSKYDLVLYFSNLETASNQTAIRINWAPPMGIDAPWFVSEIPTAFVSFASPYHLLDVPMIKTFINAYTANEFTIESVVDKLMGRSAFKGVNPVDPFCGLWEAKL